MRVGFVGWRGMVGSVLRQRMDEEQDWDGFTPVFFSTSDIGGQSPVCGGEVRADQALQDAYDIDALASCDILVTCQGSDWTQACHPVLRSAGWRGLWIDAASALRMAEDAVIVLDPLNRAAIDGALARGAVDFIGGNCTVSLLLLGVAGLFRAGLVDWMTTMTYQAASGAGAQAMSELVHQMGDLGNAAAALGPSASALQLEAAVHTRMHAPEHPTKAFGYPLAASLLPYIDKEQPNGQSREEWKAQAEARRILGNEHPIYIDGIAVRTGSLRCHAQAVTIGLSRDADMDEIEAAIRATSPWTQWVPNHREDSLRALTPAAVSGSLQVPVGRVRRLSTHPRHIAAFTIGDQLLWGAAEPLRRMLRIARGIAP